MKYHGSIERIRKDALKETEKRTISEIYIFFKIQLTQNAYRRLWGGGGWGGVGGGGWS